MLAAAAALLGLVPLAQGCGQRAGGCRGPTGVCGGRCSAAPGGLISRPGPWALGPSTASNGPWAGNLEVGCHEEALHMPEAGCELRAAAPGAEAVQTGHPGHRRSAPWPVIGLRNQTPIAAGCALAFRCIECRHAAVGGAAALRQRQGGAAPAHDAGTCDSPWLLLFLALDHRPSSAQLSGERRESTNARAE